MSRFGNGIFIVLVGAVSGALLASILRRATGKSRPTASASPRPRRLWRTAAVDRLVAVTGAAAAVMGAAAAVLSLFVGHGAPSAISAEPSPTATIKASQTSSAVTSPVVSAAVPDSGMAQAATPSVSPSQSRVPDVVRNFVPVR